MKGIEYVDPKGIYTNDIAHNKTYSGGKYVGCRHGSKVYNPYCKEYNPEAMKLRIYIKKIMKVMRVTRISDIPRQAAKHPKRYLEALKYARGETTLGDILNGNRNVDTRRKCREIMKKIFNRELFEKVQKLKIYINNDQIQKFHIYMELLLEWNKKINLTAITDESEIILKHFVDSLTVLKYIDEKDKIIDVGTGAGFPGIPIAIMMPNVKITLLDSLNKRISFLNEVIKELDLKNVETIHSRSEDCGKDMLFREKYNIALARAVANLSTLSEYLLPFVKIKGKMVCMKGSEIEEELKNAEYTIKVLGGKVVQRDEFVLPGSDIKRNIIVVEKEQFTPKMYPRKAGLPAKEPIIKK